MSWPVLTLGKLVEIKTGKLDANAAVAGGCYPFFTCSRNNLEIETYAFDDDAVIVAGNGDLNVKHFKGKFNAYQRTYVITVSDSTKLYSRYLYYFMDKYVERLRELSIGGVIKYIKLGMLTEAEIPLPPLAEQKRIAVILDKADAIRRKRQQSIQLAEEFLRAIFLDMFGDPATNPKNWDICFLSDLCKKITDGTHHSPPITEKGIPYITAKHLKSTGLEFFKNPWFVSEESHKSIFSRCDPEKYDVLYIKDGATTGLAAINEYDFEFSMLSSLALLKPNRDKILPEFLCMFLNHPRSKLVITANMAGAAITRLTLAKIKNINVPLPPIDEQKKFAEIYWKVMYLAKKTNLSEGLIVESFSSLSQKAFSAQT